MSERDEERDRRPLADRRPPEQVEDSPTGGPDIAGEDAPSATDPPNQWKDSDREGEDPADPPTRV